jgi:NAD(P)-dependent dehydrogenase (short-subunit alcohol dehydrogenase family)
MRLTGKLALITGGSDGIGRGIAEAYARNGADLLLVARDPSKLKTAAAAVRAAGAKTVHILVADLGREDGIGKVVAKVQTLGTALDVLVNNAGTGTFIPFSDVPRAEYDRIVWLNVTVPFFLTQELLPSLRAPGGSIINLSSYFSRKMLPGRPSSVYSLSKGAIDSLTRAMAMELAPRGIRVNAIAPGTIDTPMRRSTIASLSASKQQELAELAKRSYPAGRIGRVEDVGGIAVYLASDEAQWNTGAIIPVDGGLTIN